MDDTLRNLPERKKDREEALVNCFLSRLKLKRCAIKPMETPDFDLIWDTNPPLSVGVEITEFHTDIGNGKGSEYKWAQGKLKKLERSIEKKKCVEISGNLVDVCNMDCAVLIEEINGITTSEIDTQFRVGGLEIKVRPGLERHVWWTGIQSGNLGEIDISLKKIIEEKCDKANRHYRDGEKWLLICAIPLVVSSYGPVYDASEISSVDILPFDSIFYWDAFSENIWSLGPNGTRIVVDPAGKFIHESAYPISVKNLLEIQ